MQHRFCIHGTCKYCLYCCWPRILWCNARINNKIHILWHFGVTIKNQIILHYIGGWRMKIQWNKNHLKFSNATNQPIRLTVKFNLWSMEYKFLFAKVHAFMEHIQSRMYDKTNGIDRTDDKFEFKEHKITGKTSLIVIKIFFIRNWNTFDHYGLQIVNSIFWDFSMEKALNFCIYHDEIGI